jgi:crotonobetainyl-CoA:carnitine CoA-transferase CaiB-like acyl-CoA transferase
LTDVLGALVAAEGVLAALVRRERTGLGARVETSLHSAATGLQAHVLEACASGTGAARPGWRGAGRPLRVRDGLVVVAALDGRLVVPVLTDLAALPADPRFAPFFERVGGCRVPARPWRFTA